MMSELNLVAVTYSGVRIKLFTVNNKDIPLAEKVLIERGYLPLSGHIRNDIRIFNFDCITIMSIIRTVLGGCLDAVIQSGTYATIIDTLYGDRYKDLYVEYIK